jgi:hypothetical protein
MLFFIIPVLESSKSVDQLRGAGAVSTKLERSRLVQNHVEKAIVRSEASKGSC